MGIKNKQLTHGFTLIEMVIVVGIISMLLPVMFSIIFTIMQQQEKIYSISEIKRQGDNALTFIQNTISENAVSIYAKEDKATEVCNNISTASSPITTAYFTNSKGYLFRVYLDPVSKSIHYESFFEDGTSQDLALTSSKVIISGFTVDCLKKADRSAPLVQVQFKVTYNTAVLPLRTLNYSTIIKMQAH